MKFIVAAALSAAFAALCASQSACAEVDTGNLQINAAHDGHIRFKKDFHAPLKQKWITDLGNPVTHALFGDGMVFVIAGRSLGQNILYALDAKDGSVIWHVNANGNPPTYSHGRVFVLQEGGLLTSYDAKTGAVIWSVQQQNESLFMDEPVALGESVYFDGEGEATETYSANAKTGQGRWMKGEAGGSSTPAVGGGNVYLAYVCDDEAYDIKTGARKWSYTAGCDGGGGGTPVYFDGRVYINDGENNVVLDAQTGQLLQPFVQYTALPAFWTSADGSKSVGAVLDGTGTMSGFRPSTGKRVWTVSPNSFMTPPLFINDTLFIADFGGNLDAYDPETGAQIWTVPLGQDMQQNSPSLSAGGNMLLVPAGNQVSAWTAKH